MISKMRCKKNVKDLKSHKNKILFSLQKLHDHAKRGNFSSHRVLDSSSLVCLALLEIEYLNLLGMFGGDTKKNGKLVANVMIIFFENFRKFLTFFILDRLT